MKTNAEKDEILRKTMVKKVNVVARLPVRTVYPPMYGTYEGIMMSPANILKCLIHKAYVEEILEDGSTLELNMQNYNTINKPVVKKEPRLESRRKATDPITYDEIKSKTAPIPPSHFLYDVKDENDSEDAMDKYEAHENDEAAGQAQMAMASHGPDRDLPIAEEEKTHFSSEFEKNSTTGDSKGTKTEKKK